jgi:hypothetical protein
MSFTKKCLSNTLNNILDLDTMGPKVELNFNNKTTYKTLIGTLASILCLVMSLFSISSTIESAIYKTNPDVYINTLYDNKEITFNSSNFKLFFNILAYNTTTYSLRTLTKEEFGIPVYATIKQNSSGFHILTNGLLPLTECDEEFSNYNEGYLPGSSNFTQEEIDQIRRSSYCLPRSNYTLSSDNKDYEMLGVVFPYHSFKAAYKNFGSICVKITYQNKLLKPNDFKNHYQMVWQEFFFYLDHTTQNFYTLYLEQYRIIKDQTFFLFADEIGQSGINGAGFGDTGYLKKDIQDVDFFAGVFLKRKNTLTESIIKYKAVNDILSAFGGTYGVLYQLFYFIVNLIIYRHFNVSIIGSVYDFYSPRGTEEITLQTFKGIINDNNFHSYNNIEKKGSPRLLVLKNNLLNSIDKHSSESSLSNDNDLFVQKCLDKIKANKYLRLNSLLKVIKFSLCRYDRAFVKAVDVYKNKLDEFLDVTNFIKMQLRFKKVINILFTEIERSIIESNSVNVRKHLDKNIGCDIDKEIIIRNILNNKTPEDPRHQKLLEYFINNNF